MLTTLILLAVLFLAGLLYTCSVHSPTKLRALLHLPNRQPSSLHSSHGQAALMHAKPTSSTQQVPGRESAAAEAAAGDDDDEDHAEVGMAFSTFDSDGDGVITVDELWQSLARMGMSSSDKDVADMIRRLDSNGDGVVDINEFRELYRSVGGTTRPSRGGYPDRGPHGTAAVPGGRGDEGEGDMREAFDLFDGDGDGHITVDELNAVMKSMGKKEGYTPASCREMIRQVDMDGDGKVSFDEFKLMMKVK